MDYNKFFGIFHLLYRNQELPTTPSTSKKLATKVRISEPKIKETSPILEDSPKSIPKLKKKDKTPVHQYFYQSVDTQNNDPNPDSSSENSSSSYEQSSSNSESQYADISGLLMVQPSTKTDEPSTSAPIVESDNENEEQGKFTN